MRKLEHIIVDISSGRGEGATKYCGVDGKERHTVTTAVAFFCHSWSTYIAKSTGLSGMERVIVCLSAVFEKYDKGGVVSL